MVFVGLFGLMVVLNVFVGWVVGRALYGQRPFQGLRLEWFFALFTLGALLNGWVGLILTELGVFSVWLWGVLVCGGAVLAGGWLWVRGRPFQRPVFTDEPLVVPFVQRALPFWVMYVLLGVWLVVAVGLFFRPHGSTAGGADVGVYVNLAAHIARTGTIEIYDEILATLEPELYPAFLRVISTPQGDDYYWSSGLIVPDESGRILPPFYHLFPVWQAVAYHFGGVQAALMMTGFWAVWGSMAVYMVLRRLTRPWWAFIGLVVLTVCALQVWFARYATTEMLTQFLFWAGLWGFIAWGDTEYEDGGLALLAGLAWGSTFLARIDTFFILPIPALIFIYLLYQQKLGRRQWLFFVPLVILPIHSVIHGLLFTPYYFNIVGQQVINALERYGLILVILAPVGVIVAVVLWRNLGVVLAWWGRFERPLRLLAVGLTLGLFAYHWFIRPVVGEPFEYVNPWDNVLVQQWNHENLLRLGWYLSPVGILLAALGVAFLIWCVNKRNWSLLLLGGIYAIVYISSVRSNAIQIYVMRRYVPAVFPFFVAAATLLLAAVGEREKWWREAAAVGVSVIWLGAVVWHAQGFVAHVDLPGYPEEIAEIAAQLEPESVLLFNQNTDVGIGDHVGVPLALTHGHSVFVLRHMEQLDRELFSQAVARWQSEGRTVYWMQIPGGHEWPLPEVLLEYQFGYAIPVRTLETPVTHKPVEVFEGIWPSDVYVVEDVR